MTKRVTKENGGTSGDAALAAKERMKLYCAAHPGSPSAIRCPHLFVREQLWIALLGPNAEQGIVGIGSSVEAALSDFDAQYLDYLRSPAAGRGKSNTMIISKRGHEAKIGAATLSNYPNS